MRKTFSLVSASRWYWLKCTRCEMSSPTHPPSSTKWEFWRKQITENTLQNPGERSGINKGEAEWLGVLGKTVILEKTGGDQGRNFLHAEVKLIRIPTLPEGKKTHLPCFLGFWCVLSFLAVMDCPFPSFPISRTQLRGLIQLWIFNLKAVSLKWQSVLHGGKYLLQMEWERD